MGLKLYILSILIYYVSSQNYDTSDEMLNYKYNYLETNPSEQELLKYARQLYFCITINKKYDTDKIYIKNASLDWGKWTADRWSDEEIDSPINKIINTEYTICCKQEDFSLFGPVGTLEIHVEEYTNSYYLYVWWDIAKLGYEPYGFGGGGLKTITPINLDKNWIKLTL